MKKFPHLLSGTIAMALSFSLLTSLCATAADASTSPDPSEGWEYSIASPVLAPNSNISPLVDLESNGTGYIHYNDLFDSAYAETERWGWITATYMYAKISIGQRSLNKSSNGSKKSIRTNSLYAAAGEKLAISNHTITSTTNGTQYFRASHTF